MFVVVEGGCTLVDAVFTFGKNGFKIDSAGIKCLRDGWLFANAVAFEDTSNVGTFGC